MINEWNQETARRHVWATISEKENYMMARCKNILANNLVSVINDFCKNPTEETKNKFDMVLEEVRRTRLAEVFFEENVSKNKNAKFYESATLDHEKKMGTTPELPKSLDIEEEQRKFVEQIEAAKAKALEERKKQLGL